MTLALQLHVRALVLIRSVLHLVSLGQNTNYKAVFISPIFAFAKEKIISWLRPSVDLRRKNVDLLKSYMALFYSSVPIVALNQTGPENRVVDGWL